MDTINNFNQNTPELIITDNSKDFLKTASSWSLFLAIMSFIRVGFFALYGIAMMFVGNYLNTEGIMDFPFSIFSQVGGIALIAISVILFFPALYLLRFSKKTKNSLAYNDSLVMEEAFKNMKSYWNFLGVVTLIGIAFAVPFIMIAIIMASSGY
jgi:hypothetical protein